MRPVRRFDFRVFSVAAIAVLLVLSLTRTAFSTEVCEQPLYGFAWPTREIPVVVEKSPEYARKAVLDAMRIWNLAQTWFSDTYRIPSRPYRFIEVEQLGQSYVKVFFNQTQTREDWGWTKFRYWNDSSGVFYKITVSISLDLALWSGRSLTVVELQALATHEFGHALGLNHTTFSKRDLLNHYSPGYNITVPSTLNLYALAALSMITSKNEIPKDPVKLPEDIPYMTPLEAAIPEMRFPTTVLSVLLGITILVAGHHNARKPTCHQQLSIRGHPCGYHKRQA